MLDLILIIATIILVLSIIFVTVYSEIKRIIWVRKELTRPYRKYRKRASKTPSKYRHQVLKEFYMSREPEEVENLILEIKFLLDSCKSTKDLSMLLTTYLLPLISLIIATFALLSNITPYEESMKVFIFSLCFFLVVVFFVYADYTSTMLVQNPLNSHLIILEAVYEKKQLKSPMCDATENKKIGPTKRKKIKK